jgi:hypothetical protein
VPLGELMDARAQAKRRRSAAPFLRLGEAIEAIFPARIFDERNRIILMACSLILMVVAVAGLIVFKPYRLVAIAAIAALLVSLAGLNRLMEPRRIVVVTPQRVLVLAASALGSRARKVLCEVPRSAPRRRTLGPAQLLIVGGENLLIPREHVAAIDRANIARTR